MRFSDPKKALDWVGGDTEFFKELVATFLNDEMPKYIKGIETAIQAKDPRLLRENAHGLKGGLGNFFAAPAMEAALELELMGRSGDLTGAEGASAALKTRIEEMSQELMSFLKTLS